MLYAEGIETLQKILPSHTIDVLSFLTHLGDAAVLGAIVVLFHFVSRDDRSSFVVGVSTGALALTTTLKGVFARNRPPDELTLVAETGPGFPSGHALGAAVVFFLLADILETGSKPVRYAVAGVIVFVISLSRVALGVHYPVDVASGIVVAGIYLVVVSWDGKDSEVAFSAALTVAVIGVALGSGYRIPATVGIPLGGYVGWNLVENDYGSSDILESPEGILVLLLPAVALAMILPAGTNVVVVALGYGVATALVVGIPLLFEKSRTGTQS